MKIRFDEINAMADSLFLDNEEYFKAVPVDIFGLIKRLKIRLAEDDYGNDFSGAAICDGKTKIIAISSKITNKREKRLVAAHELGHLFLHDNTRLNVDKTFVAFFNKQKLSFEEWTKEEEANIFASTILLPEISVGPYISKLQSEQMEEEKIIIRVARKFKVPIKIVSLRMMTLGFYRLPSFYNSHFINA